MSTIEPITPWYKQFWPWFLITLPAIIVIACIVTITIAFNQPGSLVVDDYSRIGLATKQNTSWQDNAARLNLTARLQFNREEGLAIISINESTNPATLRLLLLHPTLHTRDETLLLKRNPAGLYHGQTTHQIKGRFYVRLESEESQWRLNGELQDFEDHLVLGKEGLAVGNSQ